MYWMVDGVCRNTAPIDLVGFSKSLTQSLDNSTSNCAIKLPLKTPEVPKAIPKEKVNPRVDQFCPVNSLHSPETATGLYVIFKMSSEYTVLGIGLHL